MTEMYNYPKFYETLGRIGPEMLRAPRGALELIRHFAAETDDFWSDSIEATLEAFWEEDPEEAVREAAKVWYENVKERLERLVGSKETRGIRFKPREDLIIQLTSSALLGLPLDHPGADILLQGIITPYADSNDGKLIRAVSLPWKVIVDQLGSDWRLAFEIPAYKWEELVAAAFDQAGYDQVVLTPRSGDFGRDVIAIKSGVGSVRIISSVKAYKPGHLVRHDDVRALIGVLSADLKASKGIVTTTSDFAPTITKDPYIAPLLPYRLELIGGEGLRKWLVQLAKKSPNPGASSGCLKAPLKP